MVGHNCGAENARRVYVFVVVVVVVVYVCI